MYVHVTGPAAAVVVGKEGTVDDPKGVPVFAWKGETEAEYGAHGGAGGFGGETAEGTNAVHGQLLRQDGTESQARPRRAATPTEAMR